MMNSNYKFRLYVETPNHDQKAVFFEVDAFVAMDFKWSPIDVCSDFMTAHMAGGVTSMGAERIDVERKKLAAEISEKLTNHIMDSIKSRDLKNGYTRNQLDPDKKFI